MQPDQPAAGAGRRVLILDFDLYARVGGGQSVYQKIVALRPGDTFYYFCESEAVDTLRPPNTVAIPYYPVYDGDYGMVASNLHPMFGDYVSCRNFAVSIARHLDFNESRGLEFDIVDVPDYRPLALFIRPALAAEGIRVQTVALAMHGTLSDAFRGGWPTGQDERRLLAGLRRRERLQFRAVDARYAISASYAREWQHFSPQAINLFDPLCITGGFDPAPPPAEDRPADLVFVGRHEKWKGPDLFLDMAWCIDPGLYRRLVLAGPEGPNRLGQGGRAALIGMARLRRLNPELPGSLPPPKVQALFCDRTLVMLPSRHDTFNLTALEALRRGCPTLVSSRAGIADWIREHFPALGWLIVDVDCSRTAGRSAAIVLENYDSYRAELTDALSRSSLVPDFGSAETIYAPAPGSDLKARQLGIELSSLFSVAIAERKPSNIRAFGIAIGTPVQTLARGMAGSARRLILADPVRRQWVRLPRPVRAAAHALRETGTTASVVLKHGMASETARSALKDAVRRRAGLSPRAFEQIDTARTLPSFYRQIFSAPQRTAREVDAQLARLSSEVPRRLVGRVPLLREMARLERRRENDLIAATYLLRCMRYLGGDTRGDLPFIVDTFHKHNFEHEAVAVETMFGDGPEREARCFDLLQNAYQRNQTKAERPLAVLDDRRNKLEAKVAVIVSLYNAAQKLPTMLAMLSQQSLASRGELEVILVDSNSPADEHGAMEGFLSSRDLPVVYARSAERETIQAAWNRGIRLSRAPYLSFLGADEGLHPDALRQLAAVLDADSTVDWSMADSIVTKVDDQHIFDSDVMPYDRTGYRQHLVYLETCYLSWVGGLYRRSIHERFGWYDETFRAAGDTEFKNRILPHIRTAHVPRVLGVFNNYPEERTTQHPRAEIEDLRAWYLWRTEAGMRYAFDRCSVEEAIELLRSSFNYRKSFCGHLSTDFDLANALTNYIETRADAPGWIQGFSASTEALLKLIQSVEELPPYVGGAPKGQNPGVWAFRQVQRLRELASDHHARFGLSARPSYELFNDNRYEQHWWSWSMP